MKLSILSCSPECYSTRRLVEAGRKRGHKIEVLNTLRLAGIEKKRNRRTRSNTFSLRLSERREGERNRGLETACATGASISGNLPWLSQFLNRSSLLLRSIEPSFFAVKKPRLQPSRKWIAIFPKMYSLRLFPC
ncbi:MAG: hypothetical protein IZT59_01790 [Verrucomicrobia bacterium]|nr:hypothetical protein [Verrucomicrobiota bacterium]